MRLLAAVLLALSAAVLGRGAEERLPDTLVWMPMGDSITEGERDMGHPDRGDAATRGGYRYQLWRQLTEAGQPVRCVGFRTGHQGTEEATANPDWAWHCGLYGGLIRPVSGNQYGAHRFNAESALEHAGYPDVITLMLGINDLSFLPSDDAAGIDRVFAGWVELASRLADLRPHSQVLVSTLLPVVPGNKSDDRFGPFNERVRAAAAAKEPPFDRSNVRLADVCRQAFGDAFNATLYKADGVHPNEQGSIRVAAAWREAFAEAIRALNAASPAIVHLHNGVPGEIRVRLNHPAADFTGATLALAGGPTLTGGEPDPDDPRVLVFPCDRAFRNGEVSAATLTASAATLTADASVIELLGSGAADNVPDSFRAGFVRLSATDLATGKAEATLADPPAAIARVGYYLELKRPGQPAQFVWVSMDARAFGNDPAQVGIPAAGGTARKAIVERLAVFGNRGNFAKSVTGGRGVIEFSPYTYTAADQPGFPAEAHAGAFGWNDTLASGGGLWGCMQVARIREGAAGDWTDPAAEMLFAYNGFLGADPGAEEIGIGSFSTHRNNLGGEIAAVYDWTHFSRLSGYTAYAPAAYERRLLEIWVEPGIPGSEDGLLAVWEDCSAVAPDAPLPPQAAFAVGGLDASAWRLTLGDGRVGEGALRTGTGIAPAIRFGETLDVGYAETADPLTVVAVVRGVPPEPLGKPLFHVGNGTTGVGCALKTATTLTGTWDNAVWGACSVFPPADALSGAGSVCVALTTGTRPARMTVFPCADGVPAWTSVTGLQGTGLWADRIVFGNFVNDDAGGLDFVLERVAVFRGVPAEGTLRAFARGEALTLPAGARFTRWEAGAPPFAIDADALALFPEGDYAALAFPDGFADPDRVAELLARSDLPGAVADTGFAEGTLTLTIRRAEADLVVLPMGDSITHGSSNGANWRKPLFDGFARDGWNVRSAGFWENLYSEALAAANAPALPACRRHNGISGQRVQSGGNRAGYLQGLDNFLDAAGHPDVITLMIGTNDAGGDSAAAFAHWQTLVRRLVTLRPDAWVIVSPIIATRGQTEEDYKADAFRPAYNEAILSLFDVSERTVEADGAAVPCVLGVPNAAGRAAFGETAKVRLASMLDAIGFAERGAANPWFLDNLHPNQAGYNRMAAVWRAAIEQIAAREEGLREPLAVVVAWSPEGDLARVAVAFNHNVVPDGLRLTVAGQEAEGLTLSEDGRLLTGALPQPLAAGREVALRLTARRAGQTAAETAEAAFAPAGLGAKANIPEAEGYIRVRWTPEGLRSAAVRDEAEAALEKDTVPKYDRVAYYLELARPGGPVRTVWVSAAATSAATSADALPLGFPDTVLQADLRDAHVFGNAFPEAAGPAACFVAFAPGSAGSADGAAGLPDGLAGWYDWNDTLNATGAYGIFQFWLRTAEAATPATLLFAYNRWGSDSGEDEVLIGDLATHTSGRTPSVNGVYLDEFAEAFTFGAYAVRNLEIWVRPTPPPKPNGAADDASAYSPAAAATLTRVNGNVVPSAVRALGNGRPLDAAATSEALACLDGIAHADGEGGVEVCYDFAVTDLTFDGGRLAVAAALRAPAGASFVPGTTFRLRSVSDDSVLGVSEAVGPDGRSVTITAPQESEGGLFRVEACRSASPLAAEAAQCG